MDRRLEALGRWCARRARLVIAVWALALVAVGIGAVQAGPATSDDFRIPGTESQQALDVLRERFPAQAGVDGRLVLAVPDGSLRDPARARAVDETARRLAKVPHVVGVTSPVAPGGEPQIARGGRIGYIAFSVDLAPTEISPEAIDTVLAAAAPARAAGVQAEVGGGIAQFATPPEPGAAEIVGLGVAVLVLLVAFGTVVAMGVTLGVALLSLGVGIGSLLLLGHVAEVPTTAPTLATMIGLGVGIDYALFVVTRHRTQLAAGMDVRDSIGRASATSGSAVVFAGVTVMIAICGLAVAGIPFVATLGFATSAVVALAVLAAITLLPAMLGLLGHRLERLRVPGLRPPSADAESGGWLRWSRRVARHPVAFASVGTLLMIALALPALSLRLGQTDAGTADPGSTQRRSYDLLAQGFGPGSNGPLLVVAELGSPAVPDGTAQGDPRAGDPRLDALADRLAATPGVAAVAPPLVSPEGTAAVLTVVPASAPQDPETERLVERLRGAVLPAATSGTDVQATVGGQTATFLDLANRVSDRLPWFIGAVVVLSCLLLMAVFRSVLIALQAAVMNILSIGAALGVIVAVFQHGVGLGMVGLEETVPIVSFIPLMMFAILFGLSMDYEVFLISSVREAWLERGDNREAVTHGLARTGRVITSAALIMISVFGAFVLNTDPVIKMFGLGLAVAVLVDATIIRCVLVPAVMILCGRANWWLPGWLSRALPHLEVEGRRRAEQPREPVEVHSAQPGMR